MKTIGFLSFGHWTPSPHSQVRTAADFLLQSIELAVAAEELGADGAYFRVHHFARQLGSPFPLLAAIGARTRFDRRDDQLIIVDLGDTAPPWPVFGMTDSVRIRDVSRVIVLDPSSRILLFETKLPYTHVWMTPGGGVKLGESHADAARRELWEEVGVRDGEIGPCVWAVEFRFRHENGVIHQRERYFLVRLGSDAVDDANREALERTEILRHRWWSCEEIGRAREDFRPRELAALLPPIVAGEYPATPLSASVEGAAVVV